VLAARRILLGEGLDGRREDAARKHVRTGDPDFAAGRVGEELDVLDTRSHSSKTIFPRRMARVPEPAEPSRTRSMIAPRRAEDDNNAGTPGESQHFWAGT
jgi:hypothetical protein